MRHKNAKDLVYWERRYPAGQRGGWPEYADRIPGFREEFQSRFHFGKRETQPTVDEIIATFDEVPPEEFTHAYELSDEDLEGRLSRVQKKYLLRFKNIRRSWALLLQYMPELMQRGQAKKVLEMSTAHGATLEILRHFGHEVRGNDYANFLGGRAPVDTRFRRLNEHSLEGLPDDHGLLDGNDDRLDWPYRPIIESIGIEVDLFDAGHVPYPYEENAFDSVICLDAIEHYCHPLDWIGIVDEFTRIARESVLIIPNPVQRHLLDDKEYMEAVGRFQKDIRKYDKRGFRCVHAGIRRNQLTVFKLVRIA